MILSLLIFLTGSWVQANQDMSVIYDDDDRVEIEDVRDASIQRLAEVTVALVGSDNVTVYPGLQFRFSGPEYGRQLNLCSSERFFHQQMYGFCSGVLVGHDRVLTAGHCLVNQKECADTYIAFDLRAQSSVPGDIVLNHTQVRRCRRIIHREEKKNGVDFAIVELDQAVNDRTPIRMTEVAHPPRSVFMIGYPWGMPAKYVGNGHVRKTLRYAYVTNLDTSSGNSGSPIFDTRSHQLVGILTEGEDDFKSTKEGCYVSKQCHGKHCEGEYVFKVNELLKATSSL